MITNLAKRLFALLLAVTSVLSLNVAKATADNFFMNPEAIFPASYQVTNQILAFAEDDLTPQERQGIQAIRQRRNQEIAEVLTSSQRQELKQQLREGDNLDTALKAVNLNSEQEEIIKAIQEVSSLKIKAIASHHAIINSNK